MPKIANATIGPETSVADSVTVLPKIAAPAVYAGVERRVSTRTAAITAAIRKELGERTELIDRAEDLAEVTITIKLQAGTSWVRGVVWQEERVCRQRR